MVKSLITCALSALRWINWLMQYAVVLPLAMMMLLVVVVFWRGQVTPGQLLVKNIESVQREGYITYDYCSPAPGGQLNGNKVNPLLPSSPVLKEYCVAVMTDAAGYAAHIDRVYTKNMLWLWLLMAVVFTGGTVVFGLTPARRTGSLWLRDARGHVFSEPDVSQLRRIYGAMSQDERDKFIPTIKADTTFRMNLKK